MLTSHRLLVFVLATVSGLLLLLGHYQLSHESKLLRSLVYSMFSQEDNQPGLKEITLLPCNCTRQIRTNWTIANSTDGHIERPASSCSAWAAARGFGQKVVSYSVYGAFPSEYYDGLGILIPRVKEAYPGWLVRVYMDLKRQEVQDWACSMACKYPHLDVCDVNDNPEFGNMAKTRGDIWRYMVVGDPLVERYVARDADMPLIQREVDAVQEWIESGKCFHVMRDTASHTVPMMAGMWGGCNTWQLSTFQEVRKNLVKAGRSYFTDQMALAKYMWKYVQKNALVHDSFLCQRFPGSSPFPTQRFNFTFVGMRTYRKKFENDGIRRPCPMECRPPNHQDWEYC